MIIFAKIRKPIYYKDFITLNVQPALFDYSFRWFDPLEVIGGYWWIVH